MKQYLELLEDIKTNGTTKTDRTGTGTKSVFGRQLRFDLSQGFPAVTTKKLFMRGITHELLWFLQGQTNIKYLVDNDVHIWDEWPYRAYLISQGKPVPDASSDEWKTGIKEFAGRIKEDAAFAAAHGELGPVYGSQWRHWPAPDGGHIDQIQRAVDAITNTPDSRRIINGSASFCD